MKNDFGSQQPYLEIEEDGVDEHFVHRYRWIVFTIAGFFIIGFATMLVFGPKARRVKKESAQVAATIFPLYDITRNIAGEVVDVTLIIPPSASPHTYEPTPSQLVELRNVRLYFAIGHDLDTWADKIFGSRAERYVVDEGIAIISNNDRHRRGSNLGDVTHRVEDNESGTDPHYWLSVSNAKLIARNVEGRLARKFPAHKAEFERNLERYLKKLDILENDIRDSFSDLQKRDIVTLHDSWYYFSVAYGFNVAGTFEPSAGREPTPRYLAALSDTVMRARTDVLYSEPQIATQGIESFASDNGLRIVELDPIGGTEGRDSYIRLMKYNAKVISREQRKR